MKKFIILLFFIMLATVTTYYSIKAEEPRIVSAEDEDLNNLVRRSYQYVALFNTLNNFVLSDKNPFASGGWNKTHYPNGLINASVQAIPRPNNDTLYVLSMLDLRNDPVTISYPAFNSRYVSLETSAFDHYCNIPLATSKGDFKKPITVLYYSAQTQGYSGEPVIGVDKIVEMSGDFAIAFLRIMPEAQDPKKFKENMLAIQQVKLATLSEFQGKSAKPVNPETMPAYGNNGEVFSNNFQEVMQFVFNHLSFNPENKMDKAALEALKTVGVEPGKQYNENTIPKINSHELAKVAKEVKQEQIDIWNNSKKAAPFLYKLFLPKGEMNIDAMVLQSVIGPLGQPASQAMYPGINTDDGKPMNALHDYVIRMNRDELPPAIAFWSATLYDTKHGFFIPNKENKYSVGQNSGMKLNAEGGIEIYIAAEKPKGVPKENWLPINRKDLELDVVMRIYEPDLKKMKSWKAPKAEILK